MSAALLIGAYVLLAIGSLLVLYGVWISAESNGGDGRTDR